MHLLTFLEVLLVVFNVCTFHSLGTTDAFSASWYWEGKAFSSTCTCWRT